MEVTMAQSTFFQVEMPPSPRLSVHTMNASEPWPSLPMDFVSLLDLTREKARFIPMTILYLSCGGEGGVGHKDTIVAMAFEPSGKRFVTGGRDGKLLLWELSEEEEADGLGDLVNEFDTGIEENEIAAPKETDRKNVLTESDDEEVEGTFDEDATPPTKTFAPSSTPITEPRRILCWNHVGVVTSYPDPESPQYSTIDIAFHDAAGLVGGRRPVTFMDNLGFIVGTLGDEGAFFATDKGGSGNKGSQVYFNRFETFGRNADKDWSVSLPSGERVLGCATGRGWGAVMTSRRYLRLFTTAGIQGPVLWLSGEPVTVVGRDRFVAVFYHRSDPTQDGTQQLGYSIIDGINGTTITKGDVSGISPGGSLTWAGFTEVCALSVMDSDGMLSMLARPAPTEQPSINIGNWVPMLDTMGLKKLMSDIYWPVEVHGGKLVCVLLRGGREYPDAARRPVTTTLSLRIPLAAGLTKFGHMEELSIRGNIALNQQKVLNDYKVSQGEENAADLEDEYAQLSAQIDKVTLQLFNNIVREGKVERAFDLTQRLHLEKSYDIAVQVSDRVGHRKLSDRIEELKLQKYPIFDEEEEDFFDDNASVEYRERNDSFEEEPVVATRQQRMEMMQHISPDSMQTPKVRRSETDVREESTDEESPPRESLKRKLENDTVVQVKKRNPFAKKPMKSPAKPISKMPASPAKLSLSRQSTFSTKSRQKQRSGKQIL
ncbi:wd-40 repeat-containing protein [Thalassiosira pseudonana CCMP1335]|uniref:Wd-40 repeat-containing protein n=1 Tax=Thalassiosira pseudonana TaxID=35128 RepID=B8C836_THAPS|nr:wd-40 repeat-containing protein [Thalassiosira pseudonana CCMP1335]EED90214.1 wd-40 repeat-containing protein [Thalassiosira pseudonana CCMP1335]